MLDLKKLGVWGFDYDDALKYGRKRRIFKTCMYLVDMIVMGVAVVIMFNTGTNFGTYLSVMLGIVLLFSLITSTSVNEGKLRAYHLIKHAKKNKVEEKEVRISSDDFYKIMYRLTRKKLSKSESVETYVDLALKACGLSDNFASKLYKSLSSDSLNSSDEIVYMYYVKSGLKNKVVSLSVNQISVTSNEIVEDCAESDD